MTIGELIISLGFRIEGADDAEKAGKTIDKMVGDATKLAAGIDVVTAGLGYMIHTALDAAVSWQKFNLTTGLSSQELQQWQHQAALANVSGQELQQAVEGLAKAKARMALTGENAGVWRFLGINPADNLFQILTKLQKELQGLDRTRAAAAQSILESAGFSANIFQMLRRAPGVALPERYIINPEDQRKLEQLNIDWQNLGDLTTRTKNKFSSELAPAIDQVVVLLTKAVDWISKFFSELERHPNVAAGLAYVGIAISAIGAAMTGVLGVMKGIALFAPVFDAALLPWIGTLMVAAGTIWSLYRGYEALQQILKPIPAHVGLAPGRFPNSTDRNGAPPSRFDTTFGSTGIMADIKAFLLDNRAGGFGTRQNNATFQNTINIHEAGDPSRTRTAVGAGIGGQLQAAGFSAQPAGY